MIRAILRNAGIHPSRLVSATLGWPKYLRDRAKYRAMPESAETPWGHELPVLTEWGESAGSLGAYFFQDQLVARWIYRSNPSRHVDVGSRLDGFIGSLSIFREVEVLDIRPQPLSVPNVRFHRVNLMNPLPPEWIASTDSLSCLHTIEHFGLGRYGDPIDVNGHLKGLAQLKQMVTPGGIFYLSTPVGPSRVEFNAHRVFSPATVLGWFADGWMIEKSAIVNEDHQVTEGPGSGTLSAFAGNLAVGIVAARRT